MKIVLAYDSMDDAKTLFGEYAGSLGYDLCFQSFEEELRTLPGRYALPEGRLYVAYVDNMAAGCVALRPLNNNLCEMKRLYIRPAYRGSGFGEKLVRQIISDATTVGYDRIVLDTLETMKAAIHLYSKMGFRAIAPYYQNPLPGVVYLGLDLKDSKY
jgi:putative acetyltransferase